MIERAAERNKDLAAALEHANSRLAEVENEREALQRGRPLNNTRKTFQINSLEKKLSDVQGKARTHDGLCGIPGTKELVKRPLDYAWTSNLYSMPKRRCRCSEEVCRDLRLSDAGEAPVAVRNCAPRRNYRTGPVRKRACAMLDVSSVGGGPLPLEAFGCS